MKSLFEQLVLATAWSKPTWTRKLSAWTLTHIFRYRWQSHQLRSQVEDLQSRIRYLEKSKANLANTCLLMHAQLEYLQPLTSVRVLEVGTGTKSETETLPSSPIFDIPDEEFLAGLPEEVSDDATQ